LDISHFIQSILELLNGEKLKIRDVRIRRIDAQNRSLNATWHVER